MPSAGLCEQRGYSLRELGDCDELHFASCGGQDRLVFEWSSLSKRPREKARNTPTSRPIRTLKAIMGHECGTDELAASL